LGGVVGVDFGGYIAVTDVIFVDELVRFDRFLGFAGTVEDGGELVEQFLLLLIEGGLFTNGGLERSCGEIMEPALGEALTEEIEGLNTEMRVGLGFLEGGNGLVEFTNAKEVKAEIESDLEVVGIALGEFAGLVQDIILAFGLEAGAFLIVIGSVGIELLDALLEVADGGFGYDAFEGGIGGAFGVADLLVTGEGAIVILLLDVEFGGGAKQARMVGIFSELILDMGELLAEDVGGGGVPLLLFEGGGGGFIAEKVAVGTGAAFEGFVTFVEAALGGDVLQRLLDRHVSGERVGEIDEDRFTAGDLAGLGKGLGEFDRALAIGRVLENDLERENGGAGQVGGEGGFSEEPMGGKAMGIGIEDLLGGDEGVEGIGAERQLAFGKERGVAGGAEDAFEKAASFTGAFELGGAECLAAIVKGGILTQERVEDGDGVIEVIALNGREAFLVLFAQRTRDGVKLLLGHAASITEGGWYATPKWDGRSAITRQVEGSGVGNWPRFGHGWDGTATFEFRPGNGRRGDGVGAFPGDELLGADAGGTVAGAQSGDGAVVREEGWNQ
jgi:hypothetical protein